MSTHMSQPADRIALRSDYLDLQRIARHVGTESRGMHAVAANVSPNPGLREYAARRAAILSSGYEAMGVALGELAAEVLEQADATFALLGAE